MKHLKSKIEKINSLVEYNYLTLKVTQSRINKGLLAIPVSLTDLFPNKKQKIKVYFDNNKHYSELKFTPYSSSSREGRIGGMMEWFHLHQIQNNEELVIQVIDKDEPIFRIISEKQHLQTIKSLQEELDGSKNDSSVSDKIEKLAIASHVSQNKVLQNEFLRLANQNESKRNSIEVSKTNKKESVPYSIKKILGEIYKGKCQLTNFTFVQKNCKPYFEIHHIDASKGNYLKNLLVVSPNIHAQFTYSNKVEHFDDHGWLRRVKFNEEEFNVFQFIDQIKQKQFVKEVHQ